MRYAAERPWLTLATALRYRPWVFLPLPLVLSALILAALKIGEGLPRLPTYLEGEGCPQPCWQGLQPGITTREEAMAHMVASGLVIPDSFERLTDGAITQLEWETRYAPTYDVLARFRDDQLMRLTLSVEGGLRLGDLFQVVGAPSHVLLCQRTAPGFNYQRAVSATLYFLDGAVEVWAYQPNSGRWRVTPDMLVYQITYRVRPNDGESWVPLGVATWHGFGGAGYSAYCR